MKTAYDFLAAIQPVVLGAVGAAAFFQWRRRGGRAAAWIAATFVLLAGVAVLGRAIQGRPETPTVVWLQKINVALVVLFPYFLYRFTTTFRKPPRWLEAATLLLTVAASTGVFLFDRLPQPTDVRPPRYELYVAVVIVQWVVLSAIAGARLWNGGAGQPGVARRRMRMLSLGAAGLALVIVIGGAAGTTSAGLHLQVVVQAVGLLSAGLFVLGFAPPAFVRSIWRREEEAAFRDAELGLMEAVDVRQAADALLPYISRLMAGGGAILLSREDKVIGRHGLSDQDVAMLAQQSGAGDLQYLDGQPIVSVPLHGGRLVVLASRYAPFFGRDEMEMLRDLSRLADLALARARLFQEQQRTFALLSETESLAHIGSWSWDMETNAVLWSDEMYRIYGLDPENFTPTYDSVVRRNHPADREAIAAALQRAIDSGEPFDLEHRIVRSSGEPAVVHARGRTVRERGRVVGMIGSIQDITERKEQEHFRERFISNAAHELRTPVTSILGFTEILSGTSGMPPRDLDDVMAGLQRAASRLATLVNNLLDLSRFQGGHLELDIKPVDLAALAGEVTASLPPPQGKVVELDFPPKLEVRTDPDRLDQMLSNLITNAYRYGGHHIVVEGRADNGAVVLAVQDDGPGVEPDVAPRLFEPFSSGSRSSSVGGSGLGLTIVKMLAEAGGGDLTYRPVEPHGARFEIRLPKPLGEDPPPPPPS